MAVEKKYSILSFLNLYSLWLEGYLEPLKTELVISLSLIRDSAGSPSILPKFVILIFIKELCFGNNEQREDSLI
jgi:hypothetical protein